MVSSAILKEILVTKKRRLKKSACSRPPVDSYMRLSLTRGDKTCPRVPGVFFAGAWGVVRMAEVVREHKMENHGHLPSQEREMGIAMTGNCG